DLFALRVRGSRTRRGARRSLAPKSLAGFRGARVARDDQFGRPRKRAMKDFARGPGRLRQLPVLARATYSIFIAFTLVALAFSAWLGADMLGADLAKLDEYYAGAPSPAPEPVALPTGGPKIDLPAEMP